VHVAVGCDAVECRDGGSSKWTQCTREQGAQQTHEGKQSQSREEDLFIC